MQKKYAVPVAFGDRAHFSIAGAPGSAGWLQLTKLDITDGVFSWEMRSNKGHVLAGNAYAKVENPVLPNAFIKPKIPLIFHVSHGICRAEFIFFLPGAAFVDVERGTRG